MYLDYRLRTLFLLLWIGLSLCTAVLAQGSATLWLPSYYSDHMVLQRDTTYLWGTSKPHQQIAISLAGKTTQVQSDASGKWYKEWIGLDAGGPYNLMIASQEDSLSFQDVLIGDVWVASGQSNMNWAPKDGVSGWEEEKKLATYPQLRLFKINLNPQATPQVEARDTTWKICSPENLHDFSAVAYFFGKFTHLEEGVPIGLINPSYGGSHIETWMSPASLKASGVARYQEYDHWSDSLLQEKLLEKEANNKIRDSVYQFAAEGIRLGVHQLSFSDKDWKTMDCPQNWSKTHLKDFSGFAWFRKTLKLSNPEAWGEALLSLGPIRQEHQVYFNGELVEPIVGETGKYLLPQTLLKTGQNLVAVRILKKWGSNGGFMGKQAELFLASQKADQLKISLAGPWTHDESIEPYYPPTLIFHQVPSLLFNGMIAPIQPLSIKGFLWYQGESNSKEAALYAPLLGSMIEDWRRGFGKTAAPFLYVQLPSYRFYQPEPVDDNWARLREAQLKTLAVPHTGMAITLDLGDSLTVHPTNKRDVGYRLFLQGQRLAYGKELLVSGPLVDSVAFEAGKVRIRFKHVGVGLEKRGEAKLRGFALAGADQQFHWAEAKILDTHTVEVSTAEVPSPKALRYAWQSNPKANLFNSAGLPASPFRTDTWE